MVKVLQFNQSLPPSSPAKLPSPIALVLNYAALDFNFTSWMSPGNLRVLRSEQSSGNLRELASQKNHLQHVSPLSMVDDRSQGKPRNLTRRKSWKNVITELAGGASGVVSVPKVDPKSKEARARPSLRTSVSLQQQKSSITSAVRYTFSAGSLEAKWLPMTSSAEENEFLADSGSECEEIAGVLKKPIREEETPLQDRVRYTYKKNLVHSLVTPCSPLRVCSASRQEELSEAVQKANIKAVTLVTGGHVGGRRKGKERQPIGMRLTMTSRTGYFQDRIISPSMVRVLCLSFVTSAFVAFSGLTDLLFFIMVPGLTALLTARLSHCNSAPPPTSPVWLLVCTHAPAGHGALTCSHLLHIPCS